MGGGKVSADAPQLFLFVIAIDGFPEGVGASPPLDAAVAEDAGEGGGDGEKEKEDEEGVAEQGPAADFHGDAVEDIAGGGERAEVDEDVDKDGDADAVEAEAIGGDEAGDGTDADVKAEEEENRNEGGAEEGERGEEDAALLEEGRRRDLRGMLDVGIWHGWWRRWRGRPGKIG